MRVNLFSVAALALAVAGVGPRAVEAEIIWSGIQNATATVGNPLSFNGGAWDLGVEQAGPTHYAYFTPQNPGSSPNAGGVLTATLDHLAVKNVDFDTVINGTTGGYWNQYPTNGGSQDNLLLWNFANSTGTFPVDTVGYAAQRISDGGDFQYGWMQFRVNSNGTVTIIQGAYQSIPGVAIKAGDTGVSAVPEIDPAGFGSALALVLGSLGMIERRRQKAIA